MSQKVVQLDFLRTEKESFEQIALKMMRGLFARDTARQKEVTILHNRTLELEEVVFRLNKKIDNVTENPHDEK